MHCHVHGIDRAEAVQHDDFSAVRIYTQSPNSSVVILFFKLDRADAVAAAINAAVAGIEVES